MSATTTKGRAKWDTDGNGTAYRRNFGPVVVQVYRVWPANEKDPTGYTLQFSVCGNVVSESFIPLSDLGAAWYRIEDNDVCRVADKVAKSVIRGWAS